MKKYIALMLAMLMLVGCLCACGGKDSGKTKFVVGFDAAFPPYGYQNEQGEYVGFDLSLAEEVCKRNDWELVKKPIDWNSKDQELNTGAVSCIWNGFTYNCADDDGVQRGDKVSFTYAYMNNEQCVVVKKDNLSALNSADALAGKKVSAENGSAGEGCAKTLMGDNGTYIGVTAQMNTLTELSSGNVDFVVIDKTMANSIIGKGDYSELAIADKIEIESEQYAVGFKKGSELTEKVNGAIKELAADGTLAELAEKYGLSNYLITEYN